MSDDTTPIYFRVSPAIWRARTWTDDMRLLACYLLTSPHRTLEGLFILPKGYICADLNGQPNGWRNRSRDSLADGFIAYDEAAEVCLIVKAIKYQRPENPNMDKAAIRRLVTVPASSLDGLFLASAQQYAPRLAERLAERLPERFGKSQLCSSSTQLNPALSAPAREEPVDNSPAPRARRSRAGSVYRPTRASRRREAASEDPPAPRGRTDTCDGNSCAVREFPASAFGPLRRAIARSKHPEQWREVGTNGPLDALLAEYSGHLCAACQAGLRRVRAAAARRALRAGPCGVAGGAQGRRGRGRGTAQPPAPLRARRAGRRPHLRGAAAHQARQAPARRDPRRSATACRRSSRSLRALRRAANQRQCDRLRREEPRRR